MKILKWISWALVVVAVLLIAVALVSLLLDFSLGGINKISYFHAATSLLLLAIAFSLMTDNFGCCEVKK